MNTDDMTREELIAHYEHRIACERQSHADRLEAAEKAFALWRERLGPCWLDLTSELQRYWIYDALKIAMNKTVWDEKKLTEEIIDTAKGIGGADVDINEASNLASAALELLLRVTEGE